MISMYYGIEFNDDAIRKYKEVGGTPWLYKSHTVFGQVYEGYDILDAVAKVEKIDEQAGIPAEQIIIESINIFEYE